MKIATVYYEGRQRRHSRRAPSDQRYNFAKGSMGAPDTPADVRSVQDALYFDSEETFRVEWTPAGKVAKLAQGLEGATDGIEAMLSEMGYRQKQRLAQSLGLSAGGSEEELTERLYPEVERLQDEMEAL